MKITHYLIIALLLSACDAMSVSAAGETLSNMRPVATQSLAIATITPIPIDYASTAQISQTEAVLAQTTAREMALQLDAANRMMVDATVTHEANTLIIAQFTQTAAMIEADYVRATQTAQPTADARHATQQAITISQMTMESSQMTAVKEAPTQLVAMTQAETARQYGWVITFVQLFAMFSLGICLLSIAAFAFRSVPTVHVDPAPPVPTGFTSIAQTASPIVLNVRTDNGGGFTHTERMIIPCTPEQLTKLVSGVLNDGQSLAYEFWNMREDIDKSAPFTRDEFTAVRNWLLSNRLAQSVGQGKLMLSAIGESLFIEWLNNQALPESYKFEEVKDA